MKPAPITSGNEKTISAAGCAMLMAIMLMTITMPIKIINAFNNKFNILIPFYAPFQGCFFKMGYYYTSKVNVQQSFTHIDIYPIFKRYFYVQLHLEKPYT